jgi:uncharacterized membrane protein YgdD (TMEM256/DUF423 family)
VKSWLIAAGAINAALAVAAGAFGAHGLRERLERPMLDVFETGARYHLIHAIGMVLCGVIALGGMTGARTAGWILMAGIVLFSGSLYLLALTKAPVGPITPIGGVAFLVGWIWLAVSAARG